MIRCGEWLPGRNAVDLSSSQDRIAAVLGNALVIFDFAGKEHYRQRIGPPGMADSCVKFSPDGRYIAVVCGNGLCMLFRVPSSGN